MKRAESPIFPFPPEYLGRDAHPPHDAEAGRLQLLAFPIPLFGQEMIAAQEKEGGVNTVYRLQVKGGIEVFRIQFTQGAVVDPQPGPLSGQSNTSPSARRSPKTPWKHQIIRS